jgi:hypothetical protein
MHGSIKERGVLQTLEHRGKAEGLELSGLGHRGCAPMADDAGPPRSSTLAQTLHHCYCCESALVLIMMQDALSNGSARTRETDKYLKGLVDTSFEEGQYEAGIALLSEMHSAQILPAP